MNIILFFHLVFQFIIIIYFHVVLNIACATPLISNYIFIFYFIYFFIIMPLCRGSVMSFLLVILGVKYAAAASGVICCFLHYWCKLTCFGVDKIGLIITSYSKNKLNLKIKLHSQSLERILSIDSDKSGNSVWNSCQFWRASFS